MNNKFYSVEELSKQLNIHPKTIQRYIREGKIKATKLGKSWRISEEDFNAFMGTKNDTPSPDTNSEESTYNVVKVSSVIDITVSSPEDAMDISNMLSATLNSLKGSYGKTSLNVQYIEPERKLRIMLWGNVKFMESMMGLISDYIDSSNR